MTSEWIEEVLKVLKAGRPKQEPIIVTKEIINNCVLKKKKNWSSLGLDKITNYWIITTLVNDESKTLPVPSWLAEGRTVMIPKKDNHAPQDFRPITCLNTTYKLNLVNLNLRELSFYQNWAARPISLQ